MNPPEIKTTANNINTNPDRNKISSRQNSNRSNASTALSKLRKVIDSLKKEEMLHIQSQYGAVLKQIVQLAKDNHLNLEHIQYAMESKENRSRNGFQKANGSITK